MAARVAVLTGARVAIPADARKSLRIEGVAELQDKLASLINSVVGKQAKNVYVKAALYGRDRIREITPVGKTGNLRRGVFAAGGDANLPNALLGMNYKIAPHAHLVEFGHAGPHPAPPHPYFRPGIARAASGIARIILDGLTTVVEDAAAGK